MDRTNSELSKAKLAVTTVDEERFRATGQAKRDTVMVTDIHDDDTIAEEHEENGTDDTAKQEPPLKSMICDHCALHGLSCNEASVCRPCRTLRQPCVHRLCAFSPTEKAACPLVCCRYAHIDAIPHAHDEPHWIVLRGYLCRPEQAVPLPDGMLAAAARCDDALIAGRDRSEEEVGVMQEYGALAVHNAVLAGLLYEDVRLPCVVCQIHRQRALDGTVEQDAVS